MDEGNRFRGDFLAAAVLVAVLSLTGSLAFAGPTYAPDLIVTLRIRPATPLVGETVTLMADVENRSMVAAPASTLLVRTEGESQPREFPVGPLAGRETATLVWEAAFPIPGRYRVQAEADSQGTVTESDETNNRTTASILVRVDLSVDRGTPR